VSAEARVNGHWGVTTPDPQPFDVVDANAADVALFEIYLDVVAAGGADPAGGEALHDVFVEGWIRRRRVYLARCDGAAVGGYFLRSNFPAMAGHIAQAGYLVARSERGRGIGSQLLAHSLEEAARHGYSAMMFNLVKEATCRGGCTNAPASE
jgi:GNAT superfamily N-acetyltransferase